MIVILLIQFGPTSQDRNKFVFLKVFDKLKSRNDVDIQDILIVSNQPNCDCDNESCDTFKEQIIQNINMIPSRCMYSKNLIRRSIASNSSKEILTNAKPSLVVLLGYDELQLLTLLPALSSFSTSNHIWLIVDNLNEKSNETIDSERKLTKLRKLKQLKFDSNIFVWKGNTDKGYFGELYRLCSNGHIIRKNLLTFEKGKIIKSNFQYIWERRKDLSGCKIKVGYINAYPYMYEKSISSENDPMYNSKMCLFTDNKTMCGNYIPLLKILAQQLNFTIRWVHAKDDGFGVKDPLTKKWNGLLGLLTNNKSDLSPCWHFITSLRSKEMDFSSPISKYGGHLYMKRPHVSASWGTYFNVFDGTYWIVLMIFFLLISILFCIFFVMIGEMNLTSSKGKISSYKPMLYFASGLSMVCLSLGCQDVSIGMPRNAKISNSMKILFLVTCLFGVMNNYVYNSSLISLLTIEKYELPINSMEDFLDKPDYQLMLMSADGLESYFSLADDLVRKKIWEDKLFGSSEAFVSSTIEGEEILMKDPKRVLFLSPDSATAFVNFPCGITRATKEFAKNSVGYGFQKNSPYVALFSYVINDLIEFGNVKYIQSSIAMEKDSMACEQNKEYKPLGYDNIFSVFILLFIGIILSCIKLIYERISCIYPN